MDEKGIPKPILETERPEEDIVSEILLNVDSYIEKKDDGGEQKIFHLDYGRKHLHIMIDLSEIRQNKKPQIDMFLYNKKNVTKRDSETRLILTAARIIMQGQANELKRNLLCCVSTIDPTMIAFHQTQGDKIFGHWEKTEARDYPHPTRPYELSKEYLFYKTFKPNN